MHLRHPAIPMTSILLALAVGCTFEAHGETHSSGQAGTTSGAEPAPPPTEARTEPAPPPETERRERRSVRTDEHARRRVHRRRVRYRVVPPPKGPERETVFGTTKPKPHTLQGNIYFLPENTQSLPDFESLDPVGTVYAKKIDVPERRFDEGFPGISDRYEWFGVVYSGEFTAKEAGTYGFRLVSDDGAKLWIDGDLVIDNDGVHPPQAKSGSIDLQPGNHDIVVEYFQGPRYQIALQLYVTKPGKQEKIFHVK